MKSTLLLVLFVSTLVSVQDKPTLPKRGDTLIVTGCVARGRVETNEIEVKDSDVKSERMTTFRLTGDKKVLESLKDDHQNHIETLTGVLRSEWPIDGQARTVGNTRIGIGLPGRSDPAAPPSYPVLEVKSAEHTEKTCR